jgi:HPt (histidine-containing phosphotransfer) domain-containing protein
MDGTPDGDFTAAVLMATIGDDAELAAGVASVFLQVHDDLHARLRRAVGSADADAVTRAAHELKGMAGMIGASRLAQAAKALEAAGRAGDRAALADAGRLASLEVEWDRVARALRVLVPPG